MEQMLCTVRVLGVMNQEGAEEKIETISDGFVRLKDGITEFVYKENAVDFQEEVRVKITFSDSGSSLAGPECRIVKKGPVDSDMLFIPGSETYCTYQTPFGELGFEIHTSQVQLAGEKDVWEGHLEYNLYSAGTLITEAKVWIHVAPRI